MNIAKKILFGLLLSGFVFTAACGDDGAAAGQPCKKDMKCGPDLLCVVAAADKDKEDAQGTCTVKCVAGQEEELCKEDGKKTCVDTDVLKGTDKGQVCGAAPNAG